MTLRPALWAVTAALVGAATIAATPRITALGQQDAISPAALAQIDALLREKDTRTAAERKIDSQLLYALRQDQGLPPAPGVTTLDVDLPLTSDGHIVVDVRARLTPALLARVRALTDEVKTFAASGSLQLHLDVDQVVPLAADPDVIFVQPVRNLGVLRAGSGTGAATTEGDIAHRSAMFRGLTGAIGAGVKIGVLSDGVEHLAAAQATGDLGDVTVLPGQEGIGDEGTAMLEVIHDLAPGAQLFFATGDTSVASLAQNIRALRAAGCDIIVDDVSYLEETPFQDGQSANVVSTTNGGAAIQAVKEVAASGALYFSAAGNGGNLTHGTSGVWEGDFSDAGTTVAPLTGGRLHAFAPNQPFDVIADSQSPVTLFWSDPLGGSANDYDLFQVNEEGTAVISGSTNIQGGSQDPFEQVGFSGPGNRVVIVRKTGAASRFLHLDLNGGTLQIGTAGHVRGHAATTQPLSFGVAATDASGVYPGPFNASRVVETYSSDGPRRIFYAENGAALTPGNLSSTGGSVLAKPDITAADRVSVSGASNESTLFTGTSAAAAHAAAIAALVKSANPAFTPAQVKTAMLASAIDIEAPGTDRDSGAGIVVAQPAQPGCTFTLSGTGTVDTGAALTSLTVNASAPSCHWVVWSDVAWIKVVNPAGTGSGPVKLIVSANGGPERSATMTVEGGSTRRISQAPAASGPRTVNQFTPVLLPDDKTTDVPIQVQGVARPISDVTVSLYLTHTFDSDLAISLIGPDGTTVPLSVHHGIDGQNYGSSCEAEESLTTFTDSAEARVIEGVPPFVGSFIPERPLAAFKGKLGAAANGTWTLRIQDNVIQDSGTLQCVSLKIFTNLPRPVLSDFDGDAGADVASYKSNGDWTVRPSSSGFASPALQHLGGPGAVPVPGDYDGDGVQDIAVYRVNTGSWTALKSSSNFASTFSVNWGGTGFTPVPGDYDGDGRTDPAVYVPATGVWAVLKSSTGYTEAININWGGAGFTPVPGQDFDGDGISDVAVYRAATGVWSILKSSTRFTTTIAVGWGGGRHTLAPGDYDGDRRADLGLYDPVTGIWSVLLAQGNYTTARSINWGGAGFTPVPADFDADGKIDAAVFQSTTGTWFVLKSTTNYTSSTSVASSSSIGDRPVTTAIAMRDEATRATDYDGDLRADLTVFNGATGVWSILQSAAGFTTAINVGLGGAAYKQVPGDFDGDRQADVAVYHPVTGDWFVLLSSTGFTTSLAKLAGGTGWTAVPADYDGDGRTDIGVYNRASGAWFVLKSSTNYTTTLGLSWGGTGYLPQPADYDGDGKADLGLYQQSTGTWLVLLSANNYTTTISKNAGGPGFSPVAADYDGDGKADFTVYNTTTGVWFGLKSGSGYTTSLSVGWGGTGYAPVRGDYDGDGKTDLAIYQQSSGNWFILLSSSNYTSTLSRNWGGAGFLAVPPYAD